MYTYIYITIYQHLYIYIYVLRIFYINNLFLLEQLPTSEHRWGAILWPCWSSPHRPTWAARNDLVADWLALRRPLKKVCGANLKFPKDEKHYLAPENSSADFWDEQITSHKWFGHPKIAGQKIHPRFQGFMEKKHEPFRRLDAWGAGRKRWWTFQAPHPSRSQSCDLPADRTNKQHEVYFISLCGPLYFHAFRQQKVACPFEDQAHEDDICDLPHKLPY